MWCMGMGAWLDKTGVATPLIDVVMLPMGATDLRVAEFPTTTATTTTAQ